MNFEKDEVLQPFYMEIVPITKLILFNFEKHPETIYGGLELQYLVTENEGKGYRLIAYRNDGYVDVYDEESLHIKDVGKFEVCGKGLKHYANVPFENVYFEQTKEGIDVAFSVQDYKGRKIEVMVKEQAKKPSRDFDLMAPIGASSENPVSFPAYALYQFDLVREKNTLFKVQIDGREIELDHFPVPIPKDRQMRSFTRYSCDCELVEFGRTGEVNLQQQRCMADELCMGDLRVKYQTVDGKKQMESLQFIHSRHRFIIRFEDLFPDLLRMEEGTQSGRFKIEMDPSMGYFSGNYSVKRQGEQIEITMIPSDGWTVRNKMFLTKVMFQKKSIFRTWPKTYCYKQWIDLKTGASSCKWERLEYKPLTKNWWKGK